MKARTITEKIKKKDHWSNVGWWSRNRHSTLPFRSQFWWDKPWRNAACSNRCFGRTCRCPERTSSRATDTGCTANCLEAFQFRPCAVAHLHQTESVTGNMSGSPSPYPSGDTCSLWHKLCLQIWIQLSSGHWLSTGDHWQLDLVWVGCVREGLQLTPPQHLQRGTVTNRTNLQNQYCI